jgi:hypothetical protein
MRIPIHCKTGKPPDPSLSLFYLVAASGVFLVKKSGLYFSVTRTEKILGLADQDEELILKFPRVPRQLMATVYGFFRQVFRLYQGEAVALIFYSPEQKRFRVGVPPQKLFRYQSCGRWRTEGRVVYGHYPRPDGFLKLGDIHSHGDEPAFFSNIDAEDDAKQDGLRIVLGHMDRESPDMEVSFVAGGTRFALQPHDAVEPFAEACSPPPSWIERVSCRSEDLQLDPPERRETNEEAEFCSESRE